MGCTCLYRPIISTLANLRNEFRQHTDEIKEQLKRLNINRLPELESYLNKHKAEETKTKKLPRNGLIIFLYTNENQKHELLGRPTDGHISIEVCQDGKSRYLSLFSTQQLYPGAEEGMLDKIATELHWPRTVTQVGFLGSPQIELERLRAKKYTDFASITISEEEAKYLDMTGAFNLADELLKKYKNDPLDDIREPYPWDFYKKNCAALVTEVALKALTTSGMKELSKIFPNGIIPKSPYKVFNCCEILKNKLKEKSNKEKETKGIIRSPQERYLDLIEDAVAELNSLGDEYSAFYTHIQQREIKLPSIDKLENEIKRNDQTELIKFLQLVLAGIQQQLEKKLTDEEFKYWSNYIAKFIPHAHQQIHQLLEILGEKCSFRKNLKSLVKQPTSKVLQSLDEKDRPQKKLTKSLQVLKKLASHFPDTLQSEFNILEKKYIKNLYECVLTELEENRKKGYVDFLHEFYVSSRPNFNQAFIATCDTEILFRGLGWNSVFRLAEKINFDSSDCKKYAKNDPKRITAEKLIKHHRDVLTDFNLVPDTTNTQFEKFISGKPNAQQYAYSKQIFDVIQRVVFCSEFALKNLELNPITISSQLFGKTLRVKDALGQVQQLQKEDAAKDEAERLLSPDFYSNVLKQLVQYRGELQRKLYFDINATSNHSDKTNLLGVIQGLILPETTDSYRSMDLLITDITRWFGTHNLEIYSKIDDLKDIKNEININKPYLLNLYHRQKRLQLLEIEVKNNIAVILKNREKSPFERYNKLKNWLEKNETSLIDRLFKYGRDSYQRQKVLKQKAQLTFLIQLFTEGHLDEVGFYLQLMDYVNNVPEAPKKAVEDFASRLKETYQENMFCYQEWKEKQDNQERPEQDGQEESDPQNLDEPVISKIQEKCLGDLIKPKVDQAYNKVENERFAHSAKAMRGRAALLGAKTLLDQGVRTKEDVANLVEQVISLADTHFRPY